MVSSSLNVSIIGAGISGLVLGRCLGLQQGLRATVFEKARQSAHRNDYGITLHRWAYTPLLQVLGLEERSFRQEVGVDDAATDDSADSFRANRRKLENLLSQGVNVKWEHEVVKLELRQGEHPPVMEFGNGERTSSDVVVGADGPHSIVRAAIAPDVDFHVLPYAVYNGKRSYSSTEFKDVFGASLDRDGVLEHRTSGGVLLQISINSRDQDKVSVSYTFSRSAQHGTDDALYRPDRPKSAAREIPPALFSELASLDLPPLFRSVFDEASVRKDRTLNWLMRSLRVPLSSLEAGAKQGAVLIGDSAHAEPILGGQGANRGILDGLRLGEYLTQHRGQDLGGACRQAIPEWEASVRESETRIDEMHGQSRERTTA